MDGSGIIEDIVFDSIKSHDLELCKNILLNCKCLKISDVIINDKGFISSDVINKIKINKQIHVYVPAKNYDNLRRSCKIAISDDKWQKHSNKKRTTQEIHLVKNLGWCG